MCSGMVRVLIETTAGTSAALGHLFEQYGCRVEERAPDHLRVAFPGASSEREALAEARLYVSMHPALRGAFRLAGATAAPPVRHLPE